MWRRWDAIDTCHLGGASGIRDVNPRKPGDPCAWIESRMLKGCSSGCSYLNLGGTRASFACIDADIA